MEKNYTKEEEKLGKILNKKNYTAKKPTPKREGEREKNEKKENKNKKKHK